MTKIEEQKSFKDIGGPIDLVAYLFRYRFKELLSLIVVILLAYILSSNIQYTSKDGFQWIPSIKINAEIKNK